MLYAKGCMNDGREEDGQEVADVTLDVSSAG